jgi:hypothetical protein
VGSNHGKPTTGPVKDPHENICDIFDLINATPSKNRCTKENVVSFSKVAALVVTRKI